MASYTNRLTGHPNVFVEQNIWSNGELMGFSPINVMWNGRKAMNRVEAVTAVTWKAAVRRVLQAADGRTMGLTEIYGEMEPYAAARAENRNWQAKVRQVLQDERFFLRVGKGIYALKTE